jgi:predicted lipoprotein with Yx(FWY)xxD motif
LPLYRGDPLHVFVSDKKPHDPNGEWVNPFGGH